MKPKLLWLVGIEGSGHDLIRDVLRECLPRPELVDKRSYYPFLGQRWNDQQRPNPRMKTRAVGDLRAYMTGRTMESETAFETISRDAIWAHREGWNVSCAGSEKK